MNDKTLAEVIAEHCSERVWDERIVKPWMVKDLSETIQSTISTYIEDVEAEAGEYLEQLTFNDPDPNQSYWVSKGVIASYLSNFVKHLLSHK